MRPVLSEPPEREPQAPRRAQKRPEPQGPPSLGKGAPREVLREQGSMVRPQEPAQRLLPQVRLRGQEASGLQPLEV